MDLSIIIVSWNAREYLLKCLESVILETADHLTEIIVVDNASTDGSPEMVKEYFPDVKLICNDANYGFAKANNIGIKQSSGRYLCFINSDIIVLKGSIDRMVVYIRQHPEVGMLGPKTLNPDRTLQPSCMGFPTLWNIFCRALALDSLFPESKLFGGRLMAFWPHDTIRTAEVLNGCFWMVRRDALDQVGLLDEYFFFYGEDIDWCKRFREVGWKVVFFPDAEAIHYGGGSSSNAPIRFYLEMQRADLQYWKKHHSKPSAIAYVLITLLHQTVRVLGQIIIYIIKPSKRIQAKYKIRRSLACIRWLLHNYNAPEEASI